MASFCFKGEGGLLQTAPLRYGALRETPRVDVRGQEMK
jgi:hypothetical protein